MTALPHPEPIAGESYSAVELAPGNDAVVMLDQRELPERETYVGLASVEDVARAIRDMVVRGAPAIGISAAYGMVLAARAGANLDGAARLLKAARPTAVNLSWAVERMTSAAAAAPKDAPAVLAEAARRIHREDVAACRAMGRIAAERIPDGATILTHCNAGALATGGFGTALGVIRAAAEGGKRIKVLADETRPYLQGARLTAWELVKDGIDTTVITDNMAGAMMRLGQVDLVVVGADRIAANGDVANKIGTYSVAVLAHEHGIPFYVAAPLSTVDLQTPDGSRIPIEERNDREVTHVGATRLTPDGAHIRNPAFDVTPAKYVTAIITERGIARAPFAESLPQLFEGVVVAR